MKKRTGFFRPGPSWSGLALCIACGLMASVTLARAAAVQPPPLPPGSSMVRIQGGMNDDEVKRETRAHHNKSHVKKNVAGDDSGPGNGNGNGKDNQGKKP